LGKYKLTTYFLNEEPPAISTNSFEGRLIELGAKLSNYIYFLFICTLIY